MTVFNQARRHWLLGLNVLIGLFLAGAVAAPILAAVGWRQAADALYAAYHLTCHQWAFRSFFLFGQQPIYSAEQLTRSNLDPFAFVGGQALGWKVAICERDLAIYLGLLLVGLLYASHRSARACGFALYALLCLPMALDGFTQLFGWRESTWELRVATGLLFGLASAWLVLPRLHHAFGLEPASNAYAAPTACEPLPAVPSPRG